MEEEDTGNNIARISPDRLHNAYLNYSILVWFFLCVCVCDVLLQEGEEQENKALQEQQLLSALLAGGVMVLDKDDRMKNRYAVEQQVWISGG